MAEPELLRCRALVVGHAGRALLPPIELAIARGELWVVSGQNGSGKTTWLRTLLGLLPPVSGAVELSRPDLRLCYLSQRQSFDPHYPVTVEDVVRMGLERGARWFGQSDQDSQRVRRALEQSSALELAGSSFHELSEGQKQRVLLARVQASAAELAVLDEPTSAMDAAAEREAWTRLKSWQRDSGVALVIVTHALALANEFADRILRFDRESRSVRLEHPLRSQGPSSERGEGAP